MLETLPSLCRSRYAVCVTEHDGVDVQWWDWCVLIVEQRAREETRRRRQEDSLQQTATDAKQQGAADVSTLPPACVSSLYSKDISGVRGFCRTMSYHTSKLHVCYRQVSCQGDHSLAVSEKTGTVYAWGYGNSGRLGLSAFLICCSDVCQFLTLTLNV